MKRFLIYSVLILVGIHATAAPAAVNFAWRTHEGDFPADKPGYVIATTEDVVTYSQVLPKFVAQKEAMGFYVYVVTEQDYGTGKRGNEQAAQVRAWLRDFQKRTHAKYALLIGNSHPASGDLPAPTIPDGEHNGLEPSYCDLDGKWVDLYLNTKEKDPRSEWTQICAGSILIKKAYQAGGYRKDEWFVGRISCTGTEIGNSIYDLDRILDKTIRYERATEAGKNLDWRADALSVITNYGMGRWDAPLLAAAEREGGSLEQYSLAGWMGELPPLNILNGQRPHIELMTPTRHRGLLATMSHGWNRGCEGLCTQRDIFLNIDDRWPAVVAVAACTGFAQGDNCNMGQAWLRRGAIFANGTGWSGNNNCRIPLLTRLLTERVTVGEAGRNEVVQYGDPSLRVLPPKGTPLRALQISPAFTGYYAERSLEAGIPIKPVTQTFTLTNRSQETMKIAAEGDAAWLDFSPRSLKLKPGETTTITATSNDRADKLAPGMHLAKIRFLRGDGGRDERRLAFRLQPLTLAAAYSFDELEEGNHFPDLSLPPGFPRKAASLWMTTTKIDQKKQQIAPGDKLEGYAHQSQGKIGGALRLDNPQQPWSRALPNCSRWRGLSASFWFQVDKLPELNSSTVILANPFSLSLDASGTLRFAQGGPPATLGTVEAGRWYFVQWRSDVDQRKSSARLDGAPEVVAVAPKPPAGVVSFGKMAGCIDELKLWPGELADATVAREFDAAHLPFVLPATLPVANYADDGILRAPKEIPTSFNLVSADTRLDLAKILRDQHFNCALRESPEWLTLKDGVLSLKPGTDFDRIDFGGYDLFLVLTAQSGEFAGRTCEHPLKVRIPVPAVNIRLNRSSDDLISFVNAGDQFGPPTRPPAKGVIRYTTDGTPVTARSAIYESPFKAKEGMKITARFFYLGEYPMAPISSGSEFGVSREQWKVVAVSGNQNTLAAAGRSFDAQPATAWSNSGGKLPQFFAWDMGEPKTLTGLSCHSTIKNNVGRIKDYTVQASDDGKTWRTVETGTIADSPIPQRISFSAPCTARYLKLEVASLHAGNDAVIAEMEGYSR